MHASRPSLVENPWFWLMLFGCVASLAVVVIGPKHAARQGRLERMAETQARVRAARELGVPTAEVKTGPKGDVAEAAPAAVASPTTPIEPYVESDFRREPRLWWLLGVTTSLMLVGTAGMLVTRRTHAADDGQTPLRAAGRRSESGA